MFDGKEMVKFILHVSVTVFYDRVTESERVSNKSYFSTVNIVLIAVFSALWTVLNLTLGRLGFAWFGLPVFCDFSVFFTLLLTTWATGRFGAASLVGIIGSTITFLISASPSTVSFAVAAILFDTLMTINHHEPCAKAYNIVTAALSTAAAAYFAGAITGVLFMNNSLEWALTFWGGWHLIGGIMTAAITLPIIGVLEKANVRKIKNG